MVKKEVIYEGDLQIEKWTDCDEGGFEFSFKFQGRSIGWCDRYPGEPEEIGINVLYISGDPSLSLYERALEGDCGEAYRKMFDYLGADGNSNFVLTHFAHLGGNKNG